jgi:hypothetical protein
MPSTAATLPKCFFKSVASITYAIQPEKLFYPSANSAFIDVKYIIYMFPKEYIWLSVFLTIVPAEECTKCHGKATSTAS